MPSYLILSNVDTVPGDLQALEHIVLSSGRITTLNR